MSLQVAAAPLVLLCSKAHCALAASMCLKLFAQALLAGVVRARIKFGTMIAARQMTLAATTIRIGSFFGKGLGF